MITIHRPIQSGTGTQHFHIYADGNKICEIGNGQKIQVDLPPGEYMIKGKVMWFGSKTLTTTVKEGQELIVRGPKYVVWLGLYPMFIYAILMFLDLDSDTVLYTFLGLTLSTLLIFFIPPIRNNYIKIETR